MSQPKIITNHQWRDFVYRWDVPDKVLADQFDYQDPEETTDGFFKYKGYWYHLDMFMRFSYLGPKNAMNDWHGYHSDSYFSGVLIRLSDDGEQYQVATYMS